MIHVIVNLHDGMHSEKTLGTIEILNDGTGTEALGNYWVSLNDWDQRGRRLLTGRVEGWPRSERVWRLVALALESALEDGQSIDAAEANPLRMALEQAQASAQSWKNTARALEEYLAPEWQLAHDEVFESGNSGWWMIAVRAIKMRVERAREEEKYDASGD